jgi:hypothetical protein
MSEETTKVPRNKISAEDFIKAVNDPSVKCINDVAVNLNLKPESVKQRMYSYTKDFQIKFRKLPMNLNRSNGLKANPSRVEALRALSESFLTSENQA